MGKLTDEELESIDILATYNCFEKIDISKMKNLKYIQLSSTVFYKFIKIQNHFMINNLKNNGFVIILFLKFMAKKLVFWEQEH